MNNSPNTIQVYEHQTIKVDPKSAFKQCHFSALEKYGYQTKEQFFFVGNNRLKFKNYVGVLQVRNLTIEVLPKADNTLTSELSAKDRWHKALISMLKECKLLKLNPTSDAKLKIHSTTLLDLYYDHFLSEVETLIKHGLRKNYRHVRQNLTRLKGKIVFAEHIKKNAVHQERIFVEHTIFDADNVLNQILLKALLILKTTEHNPIHNVRIQKLLIEMEHIREKTVTEKTFQNLRFDRNTIRYENAVTLAKLIILQHSPDLRGGNENVLGLFFDMNALYEDYILRKLKRLQSNPNNPITRVSGQRRLPFWESRGIRADIVVESNDKKIVIDTKWKSPLNNTPSDSDLKQMFVYNLHYGADLSILLYPKAEVDSLSKRPFKHQAFNRSYCQMAFIDIFDDKGKLDQNIHERFYSEVLKNEFSELDKETIEMIQDP